MRSPSNATGRVSIGRFSMARAPDSVSKNFRSAVSIWCLVTKDNRVIEGLGLGPAPDLPEDRAKHLEQGVTKADSFFNRHLRHRTGIEGGVALVFAERIRDGQILRGSGEEIDACLRRLEIIELREADDEWQMVKTRHLYPRGNTQDQRHPVSRPPTSSRAGRLADRVRTARPRRDRPNKNPTAMSTAKRLRIIEGKDKGVRVPLESPPVTIGRSDDNRVMLSPEIAASRHHAELTEDDGVWSVRDLGSMNGTWVNGERIEWPRVLRLGDKIKIAGDVMVFEEDADDDAVARKNPARPR